MLDSIRNQKRLLFAILLFLIVPSFVFFGVQGYDQFLSEGDAVATVGKDEISRPEFDNALRRQIDRFREMLGGQVDPALVDTPSMRKEVLDQLITQRVLARTAAERDIVVPDALLAQAIAQIPGLRKEDGSFDIERYRQALAQQGMNEAMFEQQLRRDLAAQALPQAVTESALAPSVVAQRVAGIGEQVREVRELRVRPQDFAAKVQPTEQQIKDYYEQNAARYQIPESARIEYVVLSGDALAAQLAVPVEELRAYYEQNKARFGTPEERRASHILVKLEPGASEDEKKAARAKAEQLLGQVRARPEDFAAVAKANSDDPGSAAQGGDLGFFRRDSMVKPFADAAFALKEGEVSDLVQSEFGWHVIRLTGVKPSSVKPFEEVRPEIEQQARREAASKRFAEAADTFTNTVEDQSDSLQPVADKLKLQVQSADNVTRQGVEALAPNAPLNSRKLLEALFADEVVKGKRNTAAIEVAPGTLVAARIVEHRPATRQPLAAVEKEVRASVIQREARRLAAAEGEARLKALRSGQAVEGFGGAKAVSRVAPQELPAPGLEAVFRADVSKLPAFVGADLGAEGYAVYAIDTVREGAQDAASKARAAQLAQRLAQASAQAELSALVETLKAGAKVVRHDERLGKAAEPR